MLCSRLVCFQRYVAVDKPDHRSLFDLIERMLEYDPAHRISMADALRHPFFESLTPEQRGERLRDGSHSVSR